MKSNESQKLTSEQFAPMFVELSDEQEETITGGAGPIRYEYSETWGDYSYTSSGFYHNTRGGVTVSKYSYSETSPWGTYSSQGGSVYNSKTGKSVYHGKSDYDPAWEL